MASTPVRLWLMILGWTLLAVAVLGMVRPAYDLLHPFALHIEGGEMFLHWVFAFLTLALAYFVHNDRTLATIGIVYGLSYVLLGIAGFFVGTVGAWHVEVGDNILHLALGVITIAAAWVSRSREAGTRMRGSAV